MSTMYVNLAMRSRIGCLDARLEAYRARWHASSYMTDFTPRPLGVRIGATQGGYFTYMALLNHRAIPFSSEIEDFNGFSYCRWDGPSPGHRVTEWCWVGGGGVLGGVGGWRGEGVVCYFPVSGEVYCDDELHPYRNYNRWSLNMNFGVNNFNCVKSLSRCCYITKYIGEEVENLRDRL